MVIWISLHQIRAYSRDFHTRHDRHLGRNRLECRAYRSRGEKAPTELNETSSSIQRPFNKCPHPTRRCDIEILLHLVKPKAERESFITPGLPSLQYDHRHQPSSSIHIHPSLTLPSLFICCWFPPASSSSSSSSFHTFYDQISLCCTTSSSKKPPIPLLSLSLQTFVKCSKASLLYSSTYPSIHLYKIIHPPPRIVVFSFDWICSNTKKMSTNSHRRHYSYCYSPAIT